MLPHHADGDLESEVIQSLLRDQWKTIKRMIIAINTGTEKRAKEYISFYTLGKKLFGRRNSFAPIYVHSKMAIFGGAERLSAIVGSANLNCRSLSGEIDTEMGYFLQESAKNVLSKWLQQLLTYFTCEDVDLISEGCVERLREIAKTNQLNLSRKDKDLSLLFPWGVDKDPRLLYELSNEHDSGDDDKFRPGHIPSGKPVLAVAFKRLVGRRACM